MKWRENFRKDWKPDRLAIQQVRTNHSDYPWFREIKGEML